MQNYITWYVISIKWREGRGGVKNSLCDANKSTLQELQEPTMSVKNLISRDQQWRSRKKEGGGEAADTLLCAGCTCFCHYLKKLETIVRVRPND